MDKTRSLLLDAYLTLCFGYKVRISNFIYSYSDIVKAINKKILTYDDFIEFCKRLKNNKQLSFDLLNVGASHDG